MAQTSIRALALELGVPERTLRRAASEGLLRVAKASPRKHDITIRERAYLSRQWPLLRDLRQALRTEPNVRLAVLFGSQATGRVNPRSDVDLLVSLADPDIARLADLAGRLQRRFARDVQIVRLEDARRSPVLMAGVLRDGRVLIDRDGAWATLKADEPLWQRRARHAEAALRDAAYGGSVRASAVHQPPAREPGR